MIKEKKQISFLIFLCSIAYFVSYVTRVNLGAIMVEMTTCNFASSETLALALTISSITYGVGQIISGYLGDRFKPENIIFVGFIITAIINVLVGIINDSSYVIYLWAVNGFAQSLMWPPLVLIMATLLYKDDYKKACVKVSYGSSLGTIAVYLISPLIIKFLSFKFVFIFSGVLAVLMGLYWKYNFIKRFKVIKESKDINIINNENKRFSFPIIFMVLMIMICIIMQGSLRDGVTNWMPTYISNNFELGSELSILTGVILPIFTLISIKLTSILQRKVIKNEMLCSMTLFIVGCISALLINVFSKTNIFITLILLALLVSSMHGINFLLIQILPAYFKKFGHVSLLSGILNASTYLGAAISTYGIALINNYYGWTITIYIWVLICLIGIVSCLIIFAKWNKFKNSE